MKALTLWPEWLPCFTVLDKRIENREWEPTMLQVGERFALHAGRAIGGTMGGGGGGAMRRAQEWLGPAAVRAGWDVDLLSAPGRFRWKRIEDGLAGEVPLALGAIVCTAVYRGLADAPDPWAMQNYLHWRVDDVRELASPVPCAGARGIWFVPPQLERLVEGGRPVAPPPPARRPVIRRWIEVSLACPVCSTAIRVYTDAPQPADAELDAPPTLTETDYWLCDNGHGGQVTITRGRAWLTPPIRGGGIVQTPERIEELSTLCDGTPLAGALRRAELAGMERP